MTKVAKEYEGRKVGSYELISLVGEGGMGAVFRAIDSRSGEVCALKFILRRKQHSDDAMTLARRLRDEAEATKSVNSPHLARLICSGEDEELGPYVVYEFLKGGSLRSFLDANGPLGVEATLSCVARPLLLGLHSLHTSGIIHRDVKPDNLLNRGDGHFKLGDLGLAHFEGREAKTRTGVIVGTPGYVAPEMLLTGGSEPTAAADCYAAALCIIEAITGKYPFKGEGAALVRAQLTEEPSCGDLVRLGLPRSLANVLVEALIRDPEVRTSSAKELLEDLEKVILHSPIGKKTGLSHLKKTPLKGVPASSPTPSLRRYLPWFFLILVFIVMCVRELAPPPKAPLPKEHAAAWSKLAQAVNEMKTEVDLPLGKHYWHFCQAADELQEAGRALLPWKGLSGEIAPHSLLRKLIEVEQLAFDGKKHKSLQKLERALTICLEKLAQERKVKEQDLELFCTLLFRFQEASSVTTTWRVKVLQKARAGFLKVSPQVARSGYAIDYRALSLLFWAHLLQEGKLFSELADMQPALQSFALRKGCSGLIANLAKQLWQKLGRDGKRLSFLSDLDYKEHMSLCFSKAVKAKATAIKTLDLFQRRVNDNLLLVGQDLRNKVGKRTFLHLFRRAFWRGYLSCLRLDEVGDEHFSQSHNLATMLGIAMKELWSPYYSSVAKDGQTWGLGFSHDDVKEWLLDVAVASRNQYLLSPNDQEKWLRACDFFDVAQPCLSFKGAWATPYHVRALKLLVPSGRETDPPCALLLASGLWARTKKSSALIVLERVLTERKESVGKAFAKDEMPSSLPAELQFTARASWEFLRKLSRTEVLARRLRGMKIIEDLLKRMTKDWPQVKKWTLFLDNLLFLHHADIAIRRGKDKKKIEYYRQEAKKRYGAFERENLFINYAYYLKIVSKGETLGF